MSLVTFMELLSLACFLDVLILCIFHLPLGRKVSIERKMPNYSANVLWVNVISLTTPLQKWHFGYSISQISVAWLVGLYLVKKTAHVFVFFQIRNIKISVSFLFYSYKSINQKVGLRKTCR